MLEAASRQSKRAPESAGSRAIPLRRSTAEHLSAWLRQSQREVFTVTATITPDFARLLLASNDANRNITWAGPVRSVAAYAEAMKRGEWTLNGETVVVSRCGKVNDGQHRLHAVIQAGLPVQMLVTFGVGRETRHTVDQGIARSPGNILTMYGESNANVLACAVQFLWAMDNKQTLNARPSPDQLLDTLNAHPEIRDAILAASAVTAHYRVSQGYIAAAHYLCRAHHAPSADAFLEAVTTGLNIQNVNSPVARLRRHFEDHRAKLKSGKLDRAAQAAIYIKAFNNHLKGRTCVLVWRRAGDAPEAFPRVGA